MQRAVASNERGNRARPVLPIEGRGLVVERGDRRLLDGLDFTLYKLFCSLKLFGGETDAVTLDTKAPVSIRKGGSLDGTTRGDWNDTLVSLDEFYSARGELMLKARKEWSPIL